MFTAAFGKALIGWCLVFVIYGIALGWARTRRFSGRPNHGW